MSVDCQNTKSTSLTPLLQNKKTSSYTSSKGCFLLLEDERWLQHKQKYSISLNLCISICLINSLCFSCFSQCVFTPRELWFQGGNDQSLNCSKQNPPHQALKQLLSSSTICIIACNTDTSPSSPGQLCSGTDAFQTEPPAHPNYCSWGLPADSQEGWRTLFHGNTQPAQPVQSKLKQALKLTG